MKKKISENSNIIAHFRLAAEGTAASSFSLSINCGMQVNKIEFIAGFIQAGEQKQLFDIEEMNRLVYVISQNNRIGLDRIFTGLRAFEIIHKKIDVRFDFRINYENYTIEINAANMEMQYHKETLGEIIFRALLPIRW